MSRAPLDLEPREQAHFSSSQKNAILLRQGVEGADNVFRAYCDEPECGAHIATLGADGRWKRERPIAFDHGLARGLYGKTSTINGRAICNHPFDCHKVKTAADVARMTTADKQAGRIGQQARRAARKARGERSPLQGRGFERG